MGVVTDGYPSFAELEASPGYPAPERLEQGAVAVIECVQHIPCDPCGWVCPRGAIEVGEDITALPRLLADQCNGCGSCIAACPGQAIFVVDLHYTEQEALVSFPYEYVPFPQVGELVMGVDREGAPVAQGRVEKVRMGKALDRTAVISLAVPKEFAQQIRSMRRE